MSEPVELAGKCPMCELPLAPGANFCGECGFALTSAPARTGPIRAKWYHNIWVILFLLFFVLGPFAIPLIWKNPKLSITAKWVLTAIGVGYACLMMLLFAQLVTILKTSLDSFNSSMPLY